MIKYPRAGWILVALLLIAPLPGRCVELEKWKQSKPSDHVELLTQKRTAAELALNESDERIVIRAFQAGDFKKLESIANSRWKSKATFANGNSKLAAFFLNIEYCDFDFAATDKAKWQRLLDLTERWQKAYPQSPFASLSRSKVLMDLAWKYRGPGYSDTVSDSAAAEFNSTLVQARHELEKSQATWVPEWYNQMVLTELWLSQDRSRITALVEEALPRFPDYYDIYVSASMAFLGKWGGSDAEFADFARHVLKAAPPGYGPMLYVRIYYNASCCDYYDGAVFTKGGAKWPDLKQGLQDLLHRYPDNFNEDRAAYFACSAVDNEMLPGLMGKIGDAPDPAIWKDSGFFRNCQKMVQQMKAHPEGPRSAWFPQ
jgi:hypothetical protein